MMINPTSSLSITFSAFPLGWVRVSFAWPRLLEASSPTNVTRLVVTVVIDAVQGVRRSGARANISQEIIKRSKPLFTDGNPTTSVPGIVKDVGVKASRLHVKPSAIFRRIAGTMLQSFICQRVTVLAKALPVLIAKAECVVSKITSVNATSHPASIQRLFVLFQYTVVQ